MNSRSFSVSVKKRKPRKGTETHNKFCPFRILPTSLRKENPERGRKHIYFSSFYYIKHLLVKKRKPRKGTETHQETCSILSMFCVKKRKPRKGTETKAFSKIHPSFTVWLRKEIPERGRNQLYVFYFCVFERSVKKRKPRKGTETQTFLA